MGEPYSQTLLLILLEMPVTSALNSMIFFWKYSDKKMTSSFSVRLSICWTSSILALKLIDMISSLSEHPNSKKLMIIKEWLISLSMFLGENYPD